MKVLTVIEEMLFFLLILHIIYTPLIFIFNLKYKPRFI